MSLWVGMCETLEQGCHVLMMGWLEACQSPVHASCLLVLKVLLMAQPLVCLCPQTGVLVRGTCLFCVNPNPLHPQDSNPRELTFEQLASQKPDPFLSRTTPISSANLSFFPATWFSLLKPPFCSSFPAQKLQTHCSCSTTRFQPGSKCCSELLLAAPVHCLCLHGHWISWNYLCGGKSPPFPHPWFSGDVKSGWKQQLWKLKPVSYKTEGISGKAL